MKKKCLRNFVKQIRLTNRSKAIIPYQLYFMVVKPMLGLNHRDGIIIVGAYSTVVFIGYLFVRAILKKFPLESAGFKYAGAMVGFLERALILTFILLGEYVSIGLVLTAKSIARFEELKNRKFSEYFLIGTLSSILFAVFTGIITLWLLGGLS